MQAILITHNHYDHVSGIKKFEKLYPKIKIFGPKEIKNINNLICINKKKSLKIIDRSFKIINCPGHKKEHFAYYSYPYFFCGDFIFSGGCGYTKEKNFFCMFKSLKKVLRLKKNTIIFPAHEYTKKNLEFSISIFKKDKNIIKYLKKIKHVKRTIPSSLKQEKKINIFLRTNEKKLKKQIFNKTKISDFLFFSYLRNEKNKKK